MRRPDVPALVAGVAIVALGVVLLLDGTGDLNMTFGTLTPVVCAAMGATLLALGLSRRQ